MNYWMGDLGFVVPYLIVALMLFVIVRGVYTVYTEPTVDCWNSLFEEEKVEEE